MFWNDPGFISNFIRGFFATLDNIGYFFLGGIFNIFFAIANAQLFQGDVINDFYERVHLILGVFMIFRLSLTLLQIIVNPDMFKDKQKGAGSLVMRIAVMLVLLTLIVPIDIPEDSNTLNEKIRTNGILFGFLYQFQDTIVKDNVLGKLILGYNVAGLEEDAGNLQLQGMEDVGDIITAEIAHAFITPTIKEGSEYTEVTADNYEEAAACSTEIAPSLNPLVTSGTMLDHVNDTCKPAGGDEIYAFDYTGFGGLVCSIVMTIIVIGFTLDVAVRAIKLAILRLIAPIPIISYISPGQEKDGAFGNWVKTLTSTYLSLFVRLIIIYFGIYLVILLRNKHLVTWVTTDPLANIFVIVGILVFMKEAPKFFQDMLGLKGDGKLFSGIGTMLGAAALGGGIVGAARGSYRIGMDEARELGLSDGEARRRARLAAIGGIFGGGYAGAKAFMTSDKNVPSSVFAAMQKRQAVRGSGVTLGRKISSTASGLLAGSSLGGRSAAQAELYSQAAQAARAHKQMLEDEALKSMEAIGSYSGVKGFDADGNEVVLQGNYQDIVNRMQQARAENRNYVELANGNRFRMDEINENVLEKLKESQTTNYAASEAARKNAKVQGTAREATYAFNKAGLEIDPYLYKSDDDENVTNVKRAIGEAMNAEREIKTNPELQWDIAADKQVNNSGK